ncbi:MAG: hypothetical protein ACKO6J_03645 [Crocinitomicaceae bacterium]
MKPDIQQVLFQLVKQKIGATDSIGNVLSEILHLSTDAVYRRYRGETSLTVQETQRLCKHFNISFDRLIETGEGQVMFSFPPFKNYDFSLETYLEDILASLQQMKQLNQGEFIFSINNSNIFQLMNFPQLVRFRLFFWAKSHLQIPEYQTLKFKHDKPTQRAFELGKQILQTYNSLPSVEIYDLEFMRGFMRQIHYYYRAQLFEDPSYAVFLCDRVTAFLEHLKAQAAEGKKFIFGTSAPAFGNELSFYLNETINTDTTFYYTSKEATGIFINHNVMNYLHTADPAYVSDTKQVLDKQLANSSLISTVNEKERNHYFSEIQKMVNYFKRKIEDDINAFI